jgi:hypothetical protein
VVAPIDLNLGLAPEREIELVALIEIVCRLVPLGGAAVEPAAQQGQVNVGQHGVVLRWRMGIAEERFDISRRPPAPIDYRFQT